jgi:hypothetical protein
MGSDKGDRVPVQRGKDSEGPYYKWGKSGKKYHYATGEKSSREMARKKAEQQGQAARASGYKG